MSKLRLADIAAQAWQTHKSSCVKGDEAADSRFILRDQTDSEPDTDESVGEVSLNQPRAE